jgi:hypothetical protein
MIGGGPLRLGFCFSQSWSSDKLPPIADKLFAVGNGAGESGRSYFNNCFELTLNGRGQPKGTVPRRNSQSLECEQGGC